MRVTPEAQPLHSKPGHKSFTRWRVRTSEAGEAYITLFSEPKGVGAERPKTPDVVAENAERAGRRARGEMRRACVHNMLRYMWVLTFREARWDHADALAEVQEFVRRLRRRTGVEVYMYSPEPHPGVPVWAPGYPRARVGPHGWHVNFFVNERIAHEDVEAAWGLGWVWVKDWGRDRRYGPLRERVRAGAGYAAKYAGKALGELAVYHVRRTQHSRRFVTSKGSRPRWSMARAASADAAVAGLIAQGHRVLRIVDLKAGGLWVRFTPGESCTDPPGDRAPASSSSGP